MPDRSPPGPRRFDRLALSMLGVVVLALVVWSATLIGQQFPIVLWVPAVPHLLIGAIGAFLVLRTDARRLGWLLATSTLFLLQFIAAVEFEVTGAAWAGVLDGLGGLFLAPLVAATILYPTGRPESRVLAGLVVVEVVGITLASVHWLGVNLGWWTPVADPLALAIAASSAPLFLSFLEQARIYRWRPLVQQKQVKWYVVGLAAVPLYVVPGLLGWSEGAFSVVDAVTTILFPLAILIGITRYRLFEIDRIVSRTLAYTLVLGVLGLVFVGGVTGLTSLLPTQDNVAVAATTVVVMALATPLARRVRDLVDRRFDRSRYEARQVVEQFGRTVSEVADPVEIRTHIHEVLGATFAPTTVSVWEPSVEGTVTAR